MEKLPPSKHPLVVLIKKLKESKEKLLEVSSQSIGQMSAKEKQKMAEKLVRIQLAQIRLFKDKAYFKKFVNDEIKHLLRSEFVRSVQENISEAFPMDLKDINSVLEKLQENSVNKLFFINQKVSFIPLLLQLCNIKCLLNLQLDYTFLESNYVPQAQLSSSLVGQKLRNSVIDKVNQEYETFTFLPQKTIDILSASLNQRQTKAIRDVLAWPHWACPYVNGDPFPFTKAPLKELYKNITSSKNAGVYVTLRNIKLDQTEQSLFVVLLQNILMYNSKQQTNKKKILLVIDADFSKAATQTLIKQIMQTQNNAQFNLSYQAVYPYSFQDNKRAIVFLK